MINLKKISRNILGMLMVFIFITYMIPINKSVAVTNITVTGPSIIVEGQSAVFNVIYSNDVIYINLSSGDIVLNGFQATVSVSGSGNSRKIVLNNVRGTGNGRSITIASGTGYVGEKKISGTNSNSFKIKSAIVTNPNPNTNVQPPKPSTNNNSNNTAQKPAINNNTTTNNQNNNNNNNNNNSNSNSNTNTNNNNNAQTEQPKEEPKEEVKQEIKPEENINYDEVIPIPNTGK